MPSAWLAVGAETDPLRSARQLQRSWERLVGEGALGPELPPQATAGMRPMIVESWRRSLATGLDPTELSPPIEADQSEVQERWLEHPLGSVAHVLAARLGQVAEETHSLAVVTDASGLLLHIAGAEWLKDRAREMNFLEGALFSETVDGTNGIGTALAADHALQVFAFEHFNQRHHQWICSSAPVHDPVSGRPVGLIDLSSLWKIAHPRSLELVTNTARTMERCLSDMRRDQDARLRRRYSDLMTRSADLLASRSGYVLDGEGQGRATTPLDIPESGGEIVLDDGSIAVAEPLGQGEAYLVRRPGSRGIKSAPVEALQRAELRAHELAAEQAALRQVATLVAREASADRPFAVIANQVARVFDVPLVRLVRYEPDCSVVVGGFSEGNDDPFPIGSRWALDAPGVIAAVRQSGRPARVRDYAHTAGPTAAAVRRTGMRSAVASPIAIEGRLWGAMVIASRQSDLPEDAEPRLADFTELVATAIANAESRVAVGRLAEEQAALRRVATLVAEGTGSDELFAAVAREVADVLGIPVVSLQRFERDETFTIMGVAGETSFTVGSRWPVEAEGLGGMILATGRPTRKEDYATMPGPLGDAVRADPLISTVGVPIVVEGAIWGFMLGAANRPGRPIPEGTEERLARFTELVATAIANTNARLEVSRMAEEQAALRRVATLVARGVSPEEIFSAVTNEMGLLFRSPQAYVGRFAPDGSGMVVVGVSEGIRGISIGSRWDLEDYMASAGVYRTRRPVRFERSAFEHAPGRMGDLLREIGAVATVGAPIVVEGHLWGFATVTCMERLPADADQRLENFTELLGTAIANADSRAELAASRARIIAATDNARRRIERDLHDGAQQRLVTLAIALRRAEAKIPGGLEGLRSECARIAEGLTTAVQELRELARGIHPSILTEGGLAPALKALGRRSSVRVKIDVGFEHRLPDHVEVAAYYTVSEALTNASKHARATSVWVSLRRDENDKLLLSVRDDGVGGADASRGTGLSGLRDRIEALGGKITIESPSGRGTLIEVEIPIGGPADPNGEADELLLPATSPGSPR